MSDKNYEIVVVVFIIIDGSTQFLSKAENKSIDEIKNLITGNHYLICVDTIVRMCFFEIEQN